MTTTNWMPHARGPLATGCSLLARSLPPVPTWLYDAATTARLIRLKDDEPLDRIAWHDVVALARHCDALARARSPELEATARHALSLCADLTKQLGPAPGEPLDVPVDANELVSAAPCFDALAFAAVDLAATIEGFGHGATVACRVDEARVALLGYMLTARLNERRGLLRSRRSAAPTAAGPIHAAPALRLLRGGAAQ